MRYITKDEIVGVWKGMGTGIKVFFLCLFLLFAATIILDTQKEVDDDLEAEKQTERYQTAVEHLMNTKEIRDKFGSDAQPELCSMASAGYSADAYRIKYLFRFGGNSLPGSGDFYTVELLRDGKRWVVINVLVGKQMSMDTPGFLLLRQRAS